jgi:uncharacterized membrane protein YgdD (TMEM256/DUF423 family)
MMNKTTPLSVSCILLALGVSLGAFGAHALEAVLTEQQLETWSTAVQYHFYHALGALIISVVYAWKPSNWLFRAWGLLVLGILLFSGSLYLLCTTGWRWLGPITPIGGVAFIAGWVLAFFGLKDAFSNDELR